MLYRGGDRRTRPAGAIDCPCCRGLGYVLPKPDAATVIAAIADAVGQRIFSVTELMHHAAADDALRAALAGMNAKQIGKLLHKNAGVNFGGCSVERMGEERGGALWRIMLRVS